ncbi:DNA polymerase III subunit delta [Candidatus Pelagibacter sp.]|nr:DNA polymerase III subunit delta [Candidatus Pelagibacter sp.]
MIIKSFELNKIDLKKNNFFLFYGENEGLKKEIIESNFKNNYPKKTFYYDESEVLNNKGNFFEEILSKSFFEDEKLIIISRSTDKITSIIEEILEKKIDDLVLILNSGSLEKRSKLRLLFEKNKEIICIAFYEDNNQTLSSLASQFFRNNKIQISQQAINLIINRCRGDRQNLKNELNKIESFIKNKKKIEISEILQLTNLAENYSVTELVDNCLAKNKNKTLNILNENNYNLEDCIIVIRTMLVKSKRLLKLFQEIKISNNIDSAISSIKPPIFWKDKQIVKDQINKWSYKKIELLIFRINEIELLIKKNSSISLSVLSDFIIEQASTASN